jgi:para-aminobenzoate synthetase / 4-amino-4-deoxychorismate lyase
MGQVMPRGPWARFDDLTAARALVFPSAHRILVAHRPREVAGVLEEVERATAEGDWAFGYVGYEAAPAFDVALAVVPPAPGDPPLAWFGLAAAPARGPCVAGPAGARERVRWVPDWTDAEHAQAVAQVREHIAAGETFQCNLTDRMRATVGGRPLDLYAGLALAQRGAYNACLDIGRHVIASASPELFFEWSGDRIRTRPMKGTAARGRDRVDDAARARQLRASPKERAENVMIVDLLRNDLAKVAVAGTVDVAELLTLERYPTVWQLTSQITARVSPGRGLVDVFAALFPCGSVTGAPKVRTMRLIADLESCSRGVYCGAVGFVAPRTNGVRARFSVAIRTVVADRRSGQAVYGAGGGITWDSDPVAERAELLAKAAVLGDAGRAGPPRGVHVTGR